MGNVVDFAARAAALRSAKAPEPAANDTSVTLSQQDEEDRSTPEGSALFEALTKTGINVINEESLRDFRTIMSVVRGMKDRQTGNPESADCMNLECLAQAMGYTKEVPQDDSFDDLLSKLD